jgi:hypothetical protein
MVRQVNSIEKLLSISTIHIENIEIDEYLLKGAPPKPPVLHVAPITSIDTCRTRMINVKINYCCSFCVAAIAFGINIYMGL